MTTPTMSKRSSTQDQGGWAETRHASLPSQDHLARLVRLTPCAFVVVGAAVEGVGAVQPSR